MVDLGAMPAGTSDATMLTVGPTAIGVSCQVIVMVPANAGSSDSNSIDSATRSPSTSSTNVASTTSESAVLLPVSAAGSSYVSTIR